MDRIERLIDLHLQDPNCTMISPWYRYPRDDQNMPIPGKREKIQWNPDNLTKIESTISHCMQTRYRDELIETLEKKIPILYIDCQQKWEDDIMLFIFREYISQSQTENKDTLVSKAIGDHTIVVPNKQDRQKYVQENTPTSEEMIHHYRHLLKELVQAHDEDYKKTLLNFERDITFEGLGNLMEKEWQKYLYLYLDKIQSLSIEEQQRINVFLYTRWAIKNDRYVRVKINNGNWIWKTRYSATGHRIQSTHDYSELNIYEDQLPSP